MQWWMKKAKARKKTQKQYKKSIEEAAGKMAHTTKIDRDKAVKQTLGNARIREEAAARCTKVIKRRVFKKQARKARADQLVKMYYDARTGENKKESRCRGCMLTGSSRKTEMNGKKNCKDIERQCFQIKKKQERYKRRELNTSLKRKETDTSRMTGEEPRLRLTWCCRPGQRRQKTRSMDLKTQSWARWSSSCLKKNVSSRSAFRWKPQVHGRSWNWCFYYENQLRNQRKESEFTGPSRWHRWCRSGTHRVVFFVWKQKTNLRAGRIYTWDKFAAETLGVARGQMTNYYARQRDTSHNVLGKHGHQDGLRRGETEAHSTNYGGAPCEMARLEWQAMFEGVESKFSFARCIRRGSVEAHRLWQKMAMQLLAKVERGVISDLEGKKLIRFAVLCGQATSRSCPSRRAIWDRCWRIWFRKQEDGFRTEARQFVVDKYSSLPGEEGLFNWYGDSTS